MSSKVMEINFGGQPRTEKGNINRVIANITDYMKQPKNDRFNKKKKSLHTKTNVRPFRCQ